MDILWLGSNYEDYQSAYYQQDLLAEFESRYKVLKWGPGFDGFCKDKTIPELIGEIDYGFDLIVVSNTWEVQDPSDDRFCPHGNLQLDKTSLPKLMFLNKEYKKLNQKLEFIDNQCIDYVSTVIKNHNDWESQVNADFIWTPFGIDLERFQSSDTNSKYDFGFTGNLHEEWIDERVELKRHLFRPKYMEFKWWHNFVGDRRYKQKYRDYSIYWGEWQNKGITLRSRAPFGDEYVKLLNNSKIFLNTKSAIGIFNPRFWELMATETLIMCPKDDYYGLLTDGENCIMYNSLEEFDEQLDYYSKNDEERKKITDNARDEVEKYSWSNIVDNVMDVVL